MPSPFHVAYVWSCGATLYAMLVGAYPFEDRGDRKNFRKAIQLIMSAQYTIPDFVHVSPESNRYERNKEPSVVDEELAQGTHGMGGCGLHT